PGNGDCSCGPVRFPGPPARRPYCGGSGRAATGGTPMTFSARSWLFAPGDSEPKMDKAAASAADVAVLDLEDAVAEEGKPKARTMVSGFLSAQPEQARGRLWVRINPLDGPHALADLAAVIPARPGGIMLPKARGRADVEALDHYLSALEVAAGGEQGATK